MEPIQDYEDSSGETCSLCDCDVVLVTTSDAMRAWIECDCGRAETLVAYPERARRTAA